MPENRGENKAIPIRDAGIDVRANRDMRIQATNPPQHHSTGFRR